MKDCYTCDFAERDNHGRYEGICKGSGNCSYEKFNGNVKPTLREYLRELMDSVQGDSDYYIGFQDALYKISEWEETE